MNLPTGFDQRFDSLRLVRELGSYSAAAQELNLSPSAIAQQIHALERELDALLFIRDGNRLLPTEVCEITADYAAQAASLRRRMELEIDASRREVSSLVVGVSPSLEDSAVSEMLARYMQLHPKAQLRIISENSRTLIALLRGRMLDLAIVDSPFPGNEFNSLLLDTDYLTAAVPNGSPLADAGHISLAQLKKEKLILRPAGSGTRTLFEASLKKRGMSLEQFNVMMEADSVSTIKRLVESNYGISVLSARACMGAVEEGRFRVLPISDLNMVRRIHICYRKDFSHPGFLGELRKLYATTMKSLPEQG
uniref:LysR family transcriptional regulator n=1 Tax=Candidatus Limivicinus sp. TaxID=3030905 RepID=UPI003FF0EBCA